jgi:hypothetical protein
MYYNVPSCNVIVIYDDIDLSVTSIRLRKAGGPGTHNGMKSVVQQLGVQDFPRIRIGVGAAKGGEDLVNRVIGKVPKEEQALLDKAAVAAARAAEDIIRIGIEKAMSKHNYSPEEEAKKAKKAAERAEREARRAAEAEKKAAEEAAEAERKAAEEAAAQTAEAEGKAAEAAEAERKAAEEAAEAERKAAEEAVAQTAEAEGKAAEAAGETDKVSAAVSYEAEIKTAEAEA